MSESLTDFETTFDPRRQIPKTMRAAVASSYGDPLDVVRVVDVPVPDIEPNQVLVAVAAASVNPLDWHMITGTPKLLRSQFPRRPPSIPGADYSGIVVSVGTDVDSLRLGDRVFGHSNGGAFAPYLAASPGSVVEVPVEVGLVEASAMGVAGLTALQGLRDWGGLEKGDNVLVNGAAGGVGTLAVQIAKALGADHVVGVCSGRNSAAVAALGADEVIDYETSDFTRSGKRFDIVFDAVGNRRMREYARVMSDRGRYVMVSGPKGDWIQPVPMVLRAALYFRLTRRSASVGRTAGAGPEDMAELMELVASSKVTPVIRDVFPIEDSAEVLSRQGTFHGLGKSVLVHHHDE